MHIIIHFVKLSNLTHNRFSNTMTNLERDHGDKIVYLSLHDYLFFYLLSFKIVYFQLFKLKFVIFSLETHTNILLLLLLK